VFVRPPLHLARERFNKSGNARDHVGDAPLLAWAWAFQERLLPCRTVHFRAEELVWECKFGIKCECMRFNQQQQHGQRERRRQRNETGWLKDSLGRVSKNVGSFESAGYLWLALVSEFSALLLTHESDRLPALSGLADYFSNGNLGAYLTRVWEKDLARGLLFERVGVIDTDTSTLTQPSAPS
jgi:hypothetical protein